MLVVFGKIFSVFIIALVGFIAYKVGWLPKEASKHLSKLLINVACPCLVIYSMTTQTLNERSLAVVKQAMIAALILYVVLTLLIIPVVRVMRVPIVDRGVYRMLLIYTNNGFIGFPMALAIFGNDGLFLMATVNIITTIYIYTLGIPTLTYGSEERSDLKSALKSMVNVPTVTALIGLALFLASVRLPAVLEDCTSMLGNMTIPLSMIVIGMQLGESDAGKVITNWRILVTCILKLAVLPALTFLIVMNLGLDKLVVCIIALTVAMPSGAVPVVLAELYQKDAKLAAEIVFLTTLLSMATIPAVAIVLTTYLGGT